MTMPQKGFTLIELMIVVDVVWLCATASAPAALARAPVATATTVPACYLLPTSCHA